MLKLASISWSFFTVDKLYFSVKNSGYLHLFSVHDTASENIDTYGGTSQQQQVSHCCLVRIRVI